MTTSWTQRPPQALSLPGVRGPEVTQVLTARHSVTGTDPRRTPQLSGTRRWNGETQTGVHRDPDLEPQAGPLPSPH